MELASLVSMQEQEIISSIKDAMNDNGEIRLKFENMRNPYVSAGQMPSKIIVESTNSF